MGCSCPNLEANRNPLVRLCVLLAEPPFSLAGTTAGVSETPPTGEKSDIAKSAPFPFLSGREAYLPHTWLGSLLQHRYVLAAGHPRATADFLQSTPPRRRALLH